MSLFWFLALGIIGTIALTAVSFTNLIWWWRPTIALVLTCLVAILIYPGTPVTLGPTIGWIDTSPFRELILFALMLIGMVARVLSVAIEHRKISRKSANEFKRGSIIVDRWDFVYPMLFAIPTYGALLSQTEDEVLGIANMCLAFQNGFFWQTILKRESQKY